MRFATDFVWTIKDEDLTGVNYRDGTIFFDADKSHMHAILRTRSGFFPHQNYSSSQKLCHSKFATLSQEFFISITGVKKAW